MQSTTRNKDADTGKEVVTGDRKWTRPRESRSQTLKRRLFRKPKEEENELAFLIAGATEHLFVSSQMSR